jgi:hypothetical protein
MTSRHLPSVRQGIVTVAIALIALAPVVMPALFQPLLGELDTWTFGLVVYGLTGVIQISLLIRGVLQLKLSLSHGQRPWVWVAVVLIAGAGTVFATLGVMLSLLMGLA